MRPFKPERFIYFALSAVIGFFATSAVLHAWNHGSAKWPITFLAIVALSLHIRQIIYHEMNRKALLEIINSMQQGIGN